MDSINDSAGRRKRYRHLSIGEREILLTGLARGVSRAVIARQLGRHPATVGRELRRNYGVGCRYHYSPSDAQRKYERRLVRARQRIGLKCQAIREYVKSKLRIGWSPETIAGRLPIDQPGHSISHESIYLHIYRLRRSWIHWLTQGHRRRRRGRTRVCGRSQPQGRVSIELRDPSAADRREPGHWEVDTVVSSKTSVAIAVAYERSTRLVQLRRMPRKTASDLSRVLRYALQRFPPWFRKTLTYDNGSENALHGLTNAHLGTRSFFCHPYCSWEKPGVEQCNGLLRRFIPKGTNLAHIDRYRLRYVERLLNTRPRKCLAYRTPLEAFESIALPI